MTRTEEKEVFFQLPQVHCEKVKYVLYGENSMARLIQHMGEKNLSKRYRCACTLI
jgi:hypothetical protein